MLIQAAESARERQEYPAAIELFTDAYNAHLAMLADFPAWQPRVTKFRLNYCREQIGILNARLRNSAVLPDTDPTPAPLQPEQRLVENIVPSAMPRENETLTRARNLIRERRADEARELLVQELRRDPDDFNVRLLVAGAQVVSGDYDDALFLLEELSVDYPRHPDVMHMLAAVYFVQGDTGRALNELKRILDINPNRADVHFNIASILLHADGGDIEAARRHYRLALALGGAPDAAIEDRLDEADAAGNQ